jgi:hypothetical protein
MVQAAYAEVGVDWPGPGPHWSEFCSPEQHAEKAIVYLRLLKEVKMPRGPMANFYLQASERWVLTGADPRVVDAVFQAASLPYPDQLWSGKNAKEKFKILSAFGGGIYFDDTKIDVPKGWTLCQVWS